MTCFHCKKSNSSMTVVQYEEHGQDGSFYKIIYLCDDCLGSIKKVITKISSLSNPNYKIIGKVGVL